MPRGPVRVHAVNYCWQHHQKNYLPELLQCKEAVWSRGLLFCRLSLGIPSSLLLSGLDLGTKCIKQVVPDSGAGARVIMQAGYMLLGAMCIALPQDVMDVSMHGLLTADALMPLSLRAILP